MNIAFSFIFLNMFIFTTTMPVLSTASAIVYDSSGNKLLRGIPYYILPLLRGSGGGLTVSQATKYACPLNVTQEPFEVNRGVPFTFNPIVLDEEFIRGAYPISIEANVINPCNGSKIWKVITAASTKDGDHELLTSGKLAMWNQIVDDVKIYHPSKQDSNTKKKDDDKDVSIEIVTTGGEFNKPESCFQIVEDVMMPGLQSYQIQNCPFKCGSSSTGFSCYNIGVINDADGDGYLGRTDAIFPVVFTSSYDMFSVSGK